MKVQDSGKTRPVEAAKTTEAPKASQTRDAPAPDRVTTDDTAKLEAALAAAKQAAGTGHSARLQAIETAVRSGAFKPDPQRIADQILDDAELTAMLQAMLKR